MFESVDAGKDVLTYFRTDAGSSPMESGELKKSCISQP